MAKSPDYKKIAKRKSKSALAIARETALSSLPSPGARRSITTYASKTPADASGKGQIGFNLFSMGRRK